MLSHDLSLTLGYAWELEDEHISKRAKNTLILKSIRLMMVLHWNIGIAVDDLVEFSNSK
jgi:hypothetical protein